MNKFFTKNFIFSAASILFLTAPVIVLAQANQSLPKNPLQVSDLNGLIFQFMRIFTGIIGMVCVVMIVIGGYKMMASLGNAEQYGSGKKTIQWAVIGLLVMFISYNLVNLVASLIKS